MGSRNCMNEACRATGLSEWKKGWSFKSGGFATLCYKCGSAYENSVFCDKYHSDESGWRECKMCGKRIHCGCIASSYLFEFMDSGGIGCIACVKRLEANSVQSMQFQLPAAIPHGSTFAINGARDVHSMAVENNKIEADKFSTENILLQLTKAMEANEVNPPSEQTKREESSFKTGESSKTFPNISHQGPSCAYVRPEKSRQRQGIKDMYHSLAQPSLNYSLTTSFNTPSPVNPFHAGNIEGSEQNKGSPLPQGQKARHIMPKPPKPSPTSGYETNRGSVSQGRVARPPAEGRGRNQLLPRYWPRITDQELQKLSGDFNSTIVPLFEKILSASDAGRIGRLVLPKACAEAYFPAINQSEGIPIRIQDITGKEWTFQFRFWPNNNSRMYVLEGVTPCIQNMEVQAGDTVTFSRIDPGGQLVIGCRKATNNADVQDAQMSYIQNSNSPGETSVMGATNNIFANGGRISDDSLQRPMEISEKKKARNIKNKRLLMDTDDINELRVMRVTWEEAQGLFRPNPDSVPAVTMVEDHEFEEFEEPPVFGKRTIYTCRPSGEQEQLAQCDSCLKWRRLPPHVLLSVKWTCSENTWDIDRSSCSVPEDINPRDLDYSYSNTEYKQRRISENKISKEGEPSGLDALATAAVLGDNMGEMAGESSVGATTTRHPRHRPGCSCIVCIQPPSGKGKHEPSCRCNVCLTVRRRFKTLMMRKKKKQTDRAAELAQERNRANARIGSETGDIAGLSMLNINNHYKNNVNNNNNNNRNEVVLGETNKGELDLNCDPHREDEMLAEAAGMSLTTLMNATILPFDAFSEQNEVPILRPCLASGTATLGKEENVAVGNANEGLFSENVSEGVSRGNVNEVVSPGHVYGGITSIYANGGNLTTLYTGSRGVSSTNVNRGVSSPNMNHGVSSANVNGGVFSGGNVNHGVISPNVNHGVTCGNVNEGVSSGNFNGGVACANINGGVACANINGGISSTNVNGGVSSGNTDGDILSVNVNENVASANVNGVVSSANANENVASASFNGDVASANANGVVSSGNVEPDVNREEG